MTTLELINDFLGRQRIAFVGASRNPRGFSRALFREFARRGYDVVPVHPNASEIEGRRAFQRVQQIDPPVEGVLVMTSAPAACQVVRDCAEASVPRVWLYRAAGAGAMSCEAVKFCERKGIRVVPGYCPFMFWSDSGFIHKLHGLFSRLSGRYPR
jgi:hypothetical protein